MESSENISTVNWFWTERIWLPPGLTWADVEPSPSSPNYTRFGDLWYPLPAAFLMILIRAFLERNLFRPMGRKLGIRASVHKKPPTNEVLEAEFIRLKSIKGSKGVQVVKRTAGLSDKLGLTDRQIDYWLKRRKLQDKPSTMDKFCETGWRALYYSSAFIFGISCLWDKAWLWNIKLCWLDYPHHSVESGVWSYYMLELSFYWSLFFSQFFDVKRKDFVEMFIHHITTIALLTFSWTCNLTRCGTLVLVIHDCADIFLEFAKLCHYAKFNTTCDIIFGIFAVVWIFTRLGLFPTWVLFSSTIEAPQMVEMFPAYYIFNGLLSVLLVLHVIWTFFILKIAYNALTKKAEELRDSRSDSDSDTLSSSEEVAKEKDKGEGKNGHTLSGGEEPDKDDGGGRRVQKENGVGKIVQNGFPGGPHPTCPNSS